MTDEQLSAEIRDTNLTYLMLAQNLIGKDKAEALFRLGVSDESADLIATLSASHAAWPRKHSRAHLSGTQESELLVRLHQTSRGNAASLA